MVFFFFFHVSLRGFSLSGLLPLVVHLLSGLSWLIGRTIGLSLSPRRLTNTEQVRSVVGQPARKSSSWLIRLCASLHQLTACVMTKTIWLPEKGSRFDLYTWLITGRLASQEKEQCSVWVFIIFPSDYRVAFGRSVHRLVAVTVYILHLWPGDSIWWGPHWNNNVGLTGNATNFTH